MHAGKVETSGRLQRALALLQSRGSKGATTRDFHDHAQVCAVSAVISELRANGHAIDCTPEGRTADGGKVYRYRLVESGAGQGELFGRATG